MSGTTGQNETDFSRPDPDFDRPEDVAELLFGTTRQAYLDADFNTFASRYTFPHRLATFGETRVVKDRAECECVYLRVLAHMQSIGVQNFKWQILSARFASPEEVRFAAVFQFVLRGYALSDEVVGHHVGRRTDGRWRITDSNIATDMEEITRALAATCPLAKTGPRPDAL